MPRLADLRRQILQKRGLPLTTSTTKPRPRVITIHERSKTKAMRLVELQIGQPIERILARGSCREVAAWLTKQGCEVNYSTLSKWRKWLK